MDVIETVRAGLLRQLHGDPQEIATASVTFLGVEPIEILRITDAADLVHYATVGGSRHPMGDPGDLLADPVRGPRAELLLTLKPPQSPGHPLTGLVRALGVLAATPAVEGVILRPDALLDLGEPMWAGTGFTAVLLAEPTIDAIELPEPADPVHYLTVIPVTATEAAWTRVRGPLALREAWAEAGIDPRDPTRSAASL